MYLLHEFGRDGEAGIVSVLREIRDAFPGRTLVFAECSPPDPSALAEHPPSTFSQLDYLLIHPLSGQGSPMPPDAWRRLVEKAGGSMRETHMMEWIGLYVVDL
jgi:hypothetical protein